MAGFDNDVTYARGTRIEATTSPDYDIMQNTATDVGDMNISGSPEGVVPANPGTTARDRTNGALYLKVTGTGNTGWEQVATGVDVPQSFVTNSGTATPAAGVLNVLGSGSITTTGAGSTTTTQLTGLTANAVLFGQGTTTIGLVASGTTGQVLQTNTGAAPTYSTATYPSTTTVSQLLYSSSANVVAGLATANRAVVTTNATGVPVVTALATDGQLIIGSTAGAPAAATLTAGTGVTITNGSNAITINATGGGVTWSEEVATPITGVVGHGYILNTGGLFTLNLPGTFAVGDVIAIVGKGAGLWVIDAPAGDVVNFGNQSTSAGGTITATNRYDCIEIIGTVANDTWTVRASVGNLVIA